ncbi:E3 ubiquitin-protein ligase RNF135 [Heteronotia binoei]|uniref:E3 ubiquitin-protein ligase RNF135 n=1 Tax=Heteronotia binoei TaxID=13085 RepID=UPI00292D07FD|nr:E3 ubiquitin-protein ligase RNF135 [Heteronotia binoei]
MATAADPFKNLQDELTCCLCLEYFKHPVSVKKCSHSFCKECITQHCKKKGTKASCPTCRQDFYPNNLMENRSLANILEIVQQINESPRAWGREPENCQELLQLFCRDDQEARASQNLKLSAGCLLSQLKNEVKISEIPSQVIMLCNAIPNMVKNRTEMKDYVSRIKTSVTEDFTLMKKYINEQEQMVLKALDKEDRVSEQKTDAVVQLLTERVNKLSELQSNPEEMLKNVSSEQAVYVGSCTAADEVTLDVRKIDSIAYAVKKLKRSLKIPLLENYPEQMLQEPSPGVNYTNDILMELEECTVASSSSSSQPQATHEKTSGCPSSVECDRDRSMPIISSQFSPWAADVTFDLERIHNNLKLTEDKRRVTVSQSSCQYERTPKRFRISQVMGSPGFSEGCHYWEVSTKDSTGWAIGVAVGKIGSHDQLGRTELSWCIEWSNKLSAWHNGQETQISKEKPLRVGTFLEIPENCLSFYSCSDKETCLHKFKIKTDSPIYPAFWIYGVQPGGFLTICNIKRN